ARRGGAPAGVSPGASRARAQRVSGERPPLAARALDSLLPGADRRRGGHGGGGAARGAGVSVTADRQVAPQPLGVAPAVRAGLAAALVVVLLLPGVRGRFQEAGLDWAYLAVLAWTVAFFIVPIVRRVAFALGALDVPAARKVHSIATPLLGGAAVYLAFAVTVLFNFSFSRGLKGVAVGATIVVALGLLDDLWDLPAPVKLAGQVAGAIAALGY